MYELSKRTNGTGTEFSPIYSLPADDITRADWREESLRFALSGFGYGESTEALLAAIRRYRPQLPTLLLDLDRLQFLEYLKTEASDFKEIVVVTESYDRDIANRFHPYVAWYRFIWRSETIEVAFPPSWYASQALIAMGENPQMLQELGKAATDYAQRPRSRTLVYAQGWKNAPQMDAEIGKITWNDLVFPTELLQQIREAVEGWANSREMYEAMGFAWRRGILLVGPPGTGKTMLGKAAAAALPDLPVLYVRDLREENHRDAIAAIFRRARELQPCLLFIEDIDSVIDAENRSILLNEMDGFTSNEGILVIASTNHPHKIDEAFLKRPSRFDRVLHIGLPAEAERAEFCRRILARSAFAARISPELDTEKLIARVVEKSKGFTPAYLKEVLTGAALALAHRGEADVLDHRYETAVIEQVEELRRTMRRLKDPAALANLTTGETNIGLRRDSGD